MGQDPTGTGPEGSKAVREGPPPRAVRGRGTEGAEPGADPESICIGGFGSPPGGLTRLGLHRLRYSMQGALDTRGRIRLYYFPLGFPSSDQRRKVSMPLGHLPIVERFQLSQHSISQVLCQVQFSPVLALREEEPAIPFQERIRREYPRYSRTNAVQLIFGPQGIVPVPQETGPSLHRFESTDGYAATLGPDFIALETRTYEQFEDVADRLTALLSVVSELYEPPEISRVGLRFVNEIRLPSDPDRYALPEIFRAELLGALAVDELRSAAERSEQVLQLVGRESGNRMAVRHGLFPDGGSTVTSPMDPPHATTLTDPFYLLDLDAFRAEALPFDVDATRERVLLFNDYIRTFFAWAVHERFRRESLGQEDPS